MATLILLEVDDTMPLKTLTTLRNLEGVIDVHMNPGHSASAIKRILREGPKEETPVVRRRNGVSLHELVLGYLSKHKHGLYRDIGAIFVANGNAAGSAGATLNKMKLDGEVVNDLEKGWSLTAKGRKVAKAPRDKAAGGTTRGGFGNEEVLALLRRNHGRSTLDNIASAFQQHGKTRDNARQTIERLKGKKLVTVAVKGDERIVQITEKANASA